MTAEPLPDPPQRPGVRRSDPRKRRTLNRDAIVDIALPIGPNMLRIGEGMLAILRAGGVPDRVTGLAMDFVSLAVNSLAYEQSLYPVDASDDEIQQYYDQIANYFGSLPKDRFPHLTSM